MSFYRPHFQHGLSKDSPAKVTHHFARQASGHKLGKPGLMAVPAKLLGDAQWRIVAPLAWPFPHQLLEAFLSSSLGSQLCLCGGCSAAISQNVKVLLSHLTSPEQGTQPYSVTHPIVQCQTSKTAPRIDPQMHCQHFC